MHFQNSCTRNCDHHILLIMTGNAHKESCLKLNINTCEKEGIVHIKTDCSDKMVVTFTINEKNYLLVSLFFDGVLLLSYFYL